MIAEVELTHLIGYATNSGARLIINCRAANAKDDGSDSHALSIGRPKRPSISTSKVFAFDMLCIRSPPAAVSKHPNKEGGIYAKRPSSILVPIQLDKSSFLWDARLGGSLNSRQLPWKPSRIRFTFREVYRKGKLEMRAKRCDRSVWERGRLIAERRWRPREGDLTTYAIAAGLLLLGWVIISLIILKSRISQFLFLSQNSQFSLGINESLRVAFLWGQQTPRCILPFYWAFFFS